MTVALKFFTDELSIEPGLSETVAVEEYLTRRISREHVSLLGWDRPGPGLYKFWLCCTDGREAMTQSRMADKDISLAPWQLFLFGTDRSNCDCLKGNQPIRTIHITNDFSGMHTGDPIEIIRISDMKVLGHGIVTAVKQTHVAHLNMQDVKHFMMLIGKGSMTLPLNNPGVMMPRILSDYYGARIEDDTDVTVIEMLPSTDTYRLNKTGPLQAGREFIESLRSRWGGR